MKIEKNKVVTLQFDLMIDHETEGRVLIDRADEAHPFVYLHGAGSLPQKFEDNINGLSKGDKFEFTVEAENAYGEYDEEGVIELPKEAFAQDGKVDESILQVGNVLPLSDGHGHHMDGRVLEVNAATVKLDLNHPLAGHNLHFTGSVAGIREAEKEELDHGHVHGEHGHHH